jgi:peroxiredoxin Q/BCP
LTEGMQAPEFRAPSTEGGETSLSDMRGRNVVLYFYPKDDTPGCTSEACAFRDAWTDMQGLGTVVLGVSKDTTASHERFKAKYSLNFPLLSDPDKTMLQAYGVWKEKTLYGKKSWGVERSTFLIDGTGVIRKVWRAVKVDGHAEAVLKAVKELQGT